jgi:hypothetical protein
MRATVFSALMLPLLLFAMAPAGSEESASADATIAAASKTGEESEFKLPPGFRPKKRGKFIVYCRKETVMGTRFPAEKCYDETGIREMLRAQIEDREKVDQMRKICSGQLACGGG